MLPDGHGRDDRLCPPVSHLAETSNFAFDDRHLWKPMFVHRHIRPLARDATP